LESELFGHKAGAFTGATRDKKGLVEEAKGGTLFLDEIGEMPIDLQPKLLRLLENGTYLRVGDTKEQKAQLRLIAATNRDLNSEIENGKFRNDLYYRIAVFTIDIPSLRNRSKDIPHLVKHFLDIYTAKINKVVHSVSPEAMDALQRCEWKGNVRELKNVIERAVILEEKDILQVNSLPLDIQHTSDTMDKAWSTHTLASNEKKHIQKILSHTQGNKAEAARLLDIGIATLYRKIEEYHLK
jgi:transcriptional regulator with PAS, ATPase and Fis domain